MKAAGTLIFIFISFSRIFAQETDWLTVPEKTNFQKTSACQDVLDFLYQAQKKSPKVRLATLGLSADGHVIPLVILSSEGISRASEQRISGKPVMLMMANIHAGEVEGKEACQMLIREVADNKLDALLENQILLIIPIFNVDGNDRFGHNRRDDGPQEAGVRPNGRNLDLNRDFLKLASPEVCALVRLFNEWDPVLFVDMHTTNGSYHREPVTYAPQNSPNLDRQLVDFMWQKLLPDAAKRLKEKYQFDSLPYGEFKEPGKPESGWLYDSLDAFYSVNYVGLRNRFAILNENYAYADFRTRVMASLAFVKSILEFTSKNGLQMVKMVREADRRTRETFSRQPFVLTYIINQSFPMTIKSYRFEKEAIKPEDRDKYPPWERESGFHIRKTDDLREYKTMYWATPAPVSQVSLPAGYIIMPGLAEVVINLIGHGITVERVLKETTLQAERFQIEKIDAEKRIYQGQIQITLQGVYRESEIKIPRGSYFVSMKQPLARLIAELLEPQALQGLARWGFLNRYLVQQWSQKPGDYPLVRLNNIPPGLELMSDSL